MFKRVITVFAFLCLLAPMLPTVLYEGGIQSAPINYKPFTSKTPPCGNGGQANCITHSPPANPRHNPCNRADHCRGGKGLAVFESMSEAQVSMATKTVQDHALLQLALLLVLAWYFDGYILWKMLIGLYELLSEHCKEQSKLIEKEAKKQTKVQKSYDSDEDKNCKEAKLSSLLDDCQKQMKAIGSEEEISKRGLCVLGQQKTTPPLSFPEIWSWSVLQSFMNNELNSLVGLATEKLRSSACEFWCAILSSKIQVGVPPIEIDWYPSYSELKSALEIYGFLFIFSSNTSVKNSSVCEVPSQSIITWIKFTDVCLHVRFKQSVLLTSDCQELAEVIICLFLDRRLKGLSVLRRSCLQSVTSSLTKEEWINSYSKIAKSLASRAPMDLNCLQEVQCIAGVDPRTKHLKSAVAFQILVNCFDNKVTDKEGILTLLISINVKEKACDFFKMYLYLPCLSKVWNHIFILSSSYSGCFRILIPSTLHICNTAAFLLQGVG